MHCQRECKLTFLEGNLAMGIDIENNTPIGNNPKGTNMGITRG